jgi:hypothetical protein
MLRDAPAQFGALKVWPGLTFTHNRCDMRNSTVIANAERLGLRQSSWRFDSFKPPEIHFPPWHSCGSIFAIRVSLSPKNFFSFARLPPQDRHLACLQFSRPRRWKPAAVFTSI